MLIIFALNMTYITIGFAGTNDFGLDNKMSASIRCMAKGGSPWFTAPKNLRLIGVESFGLRIKKAYIQNRESLIIKGDATGFYCDRISENSNENIVLTESIANNQDISLFVIVNHATLFKDNFKNFKVNFTTDYKFEVIIAVADFFSPKDVSRIKNGEILKNINFSMSFHFLDEKERVIQNWFEVLANMQKNDDQGVSNLQLTNFYGPFALRSDY